MIRKDLIMVGLLAALALSGCRIASPGTTRMLGQVEYASAFATGREVMAQHFSIASSDPETGVILSRPQFVEARGERLLGDSPARNLAKLLLRKEEGMIVAHLSVALQREASAVHQSMPIPGQNYDSVPNRTPAEKTAATTTEQNEDWQTQEYDKALERSILNELYVALHPEAK